MGEPLRTFHSVSLHGIRHLSTQISATSVVVVGGDVGNPSPNDVDDVDQQPDCRDGDECSDETSCSRVEPIETLCDGDDGSDDGHNSCGSAVRDRVEENRAHVQVFAASVCPQDQCSDEHDDGRDCGGDQDRPAMDLGVPEIRR